VTTVNDNPAGAPAASDPAWRGQASWRTTVAAGFLGLALVGGLVVALSGGDDPDPVPPAAATTAAADGSDADPATASTTEKSSTEALDDVTWQLVSGRAVPSSPTAGPTKINGPVHAGYAHTRDGAVLAALNIYTRYSFTPGDGWLKVAKAQVEPGKGREVYIKARKAVSEWTAPPGGWGQTAGYRIASYSPTQAVIEEAVRFSSGRLKVGSLTVVWRDGDWRLVLQTNGETGPYIADLQDLTGFTAFSGGIA
jgi:hypothetical protein